MSGDSLKSLFEGRLIEGRYRLVRLLSAGNFGGVFHARLELFGESVRDVAVKVTKQTHLDRHAARAVFGEAMTLIGIYDRIADPTAREFIVPVYDLGILSSHEGRGFIVMGLVRGLGSTAERIVAPDTLAAEIAKYGSGLPPEMAREFLRQICAGLAAVHKLNVVHRDLKPDNILLTDRGQIRVVDFGLAVRLNEVGVATGVAGTHQYMAPETALHAYSDPRSDVYSLGIILYEMLTGESPFQRLIPPPNLLSENREMWVLEQKRRLSIKPPQEKSSRIPRWLSELTLDCLRFLPDDGRPADAAALLQRLDQGGRASEAGDADRLDDLAEISRGDWRDWTRQNRDWSSEAARLEVASARCPSASDARWFPCMIRLALCHIQLESASKADEVLRRIDDQIAAGVVLASYRERAEYYEELARVVRGKRGMSPWSVSYQLKARQARERMGS